jgi:hypothetical protein
MSTPKPFCVHSSIPQPSKFRKPLGKPVERRRLSPPEIPPLAQIAAQITLQILDILVEVVAQVHAPALLL